MRGRSFGESEQTKLVRGAERKGGPVEKAVKGLLAILIGAMLVYYGKELIAQGRTLLIA